MEELNINDKYTGVLLESFMCPDRRRVRIRPSEMFPNNIMVEFPKKLRVSQPLGSKFRADVVVCQKHYEDGTSKGPIYLRSIAKTITLVSDKDRLRDSVNVPQKDMSLSGQEDNEATRELNSFIQLRQLIYKNSSSSPQGERS